jgi:uncharacterized LabA/DUF88 family protein
MSGDGDFSILLDYAKENSVETFLMPTDKKSTSKVLRLKSFLKITFVKDILTKVEKEKTPAST